METMEAIADRIRAAGGTFDVHAPPRTSLSFIRPLLAGVLADIARLSTLETLYLGGSNVTDEGVAQLTGLKSLKWLELSDTQVTNRAVELAAEFPTLETLYLLGARVDDECLGTLERMSALKTVGLSDTRVSRKGLARLRKARPDLEIQ